MTTHDGVRVRVHPGERVVTASPAGLFRIPGPPAWTESANCASTDPAIFYAAEDGKTGGGFGDARKVCANCSVISDCLEWAIEVGDRYGVLGGLSSRQRSKLATERRKAS